MRRFTILTLMAGITVLAIGLAALRDANAVWAGVLLLATLLLLGTAALGVIYGQGRSRAGWLGFSLFGGTYLAMVIGPWLAESIGEKLPTTQALRYVHSR